MGVTGGHSRRQGWYGGVEGKVTWGKDFKSPAENKTKPSAKNNWSIIIGKDAKPLRKNSWSVSGSVGSDKDVKPTKPAKNNWSLGVLIGKDEPKKKEEEGIYLPTQKDLPVKNKWSVSASVGSGKDEKQKKPVPGSAWQILCDMTMKKKSNQES